MNEERRSVARFLLMAVTTMAAVIVIDVPGDVVALLFSLLWGAFVPVAMRNGIASAPKDNWNRQPTWPTSFLVYGILLSMFAAPAVLVGFRNGLLPAIATAWLVFVTAGLSARLLNRSFSK